MNRVAASGRMAPILILALALESPLFGADSPLGTREASAFDLWNSLYHTGQLFHNQVGTEFEPSGIFGGRDLQDGLGEFRFDEEFAEDGKYFVEWRLREPKRIRCFRLLARHDHPKPERAIGEFRLLVRGGEDSRWRPVHRFNPPIPYGGGAKRDWLNHVVTNVDVVAREFRAEFTAAFESGPRIVELDAFATPTPPSECWDALQGAQTTRASGIRPGSRGNDVFGQTKSLPEPGTMHFRDGVPAGFVVWQEFRTPDRRTPRSFRMHTSRTDDPTNRNSGELRIFGYDPASGRWRPLMIEGRAHYSFDLSCHVLCIHGALEPFPTDRWRVELIQESALGATLYELEGYHDEYSGPEGSEAAN